MSKISFSGEKIRSSPICITGPSWMSSPAVSIAWEWSAFTPVLLLHRLPSTSARPLLVSVEWTGEVEGQGSPQWLRGRVVEVEHRAGGHHRVIAVTVGLDSSQESSIYGLNLRGNSWSHRRASVSFVIYFPRRSSAWLVLERCCSCFAHDIKHLWDFQIFFWHMLFLLEHFSAAKVENRGTMQ